IPSELPELIGMCHHIVVLREGQVTARIDHVEASQERILFAATDATAHPQVAQVETQTVAAEVPDDQPPVLTRLAHTITTKRELGLVPAIIPVGPPVAAINP